MHYIADTTQLVGFNKVTKTYEPIYQVICLETGRIKEVTFDLQDAYEVEKELNHD